MPITTIKEAKILNVLFWFLLIVLPEIDNTRKTSWRKNNWSHMKVKTELIVQPSNVPPSSVPADAIFFIHFTLISILISRHLTFFNKRDQTGVKRRSNTSTDEQRGQLIRKETRPRGDVWTPVHRLDLFVEFHWTTVTLFLRFNLKKRHKNVENDRNASFNMATITYHRGNHGFLLNCWVLLSQPLTVQTCQVQMRNNPSLC